MRAVVPRPSATTKRNIVINTFSGEQRPDHIVAGNTVAANTDMFDPGEG
jgi:hypothetical protein